MFITSLGTRRWPKGPLAWGVPGLTAFVLVVVLAVFFIVRGIRQIRHSTRFEVVSSPEGDRIAKTMGILNSVTHPIWMLGMMVLLIFGQTRQYHGSRSSRLQELAGLSRLVYLSTMPGSECEDDQLVIVDFIDDAVVACSYAPFAGPSDKLNRFGWSRVCRQEIDCGLYPASNLRVKLV